MEAQIQQLQEALVQVQQQLRAQEEANAAWGKGKGTGAGHGGLVDTRILGKPDTFHGDQAKWKDWSTVMRTYCAVVNPMLATLMKEAENTEGQCLNVSMSETAHHASIELSFILTMQTKGAALDTVINAGNQEGIEAWRLLCRRHESRARSRFASQLVELLRWSFAGDVVARLEAFDRRPACGSTHPRRSSATR